MDLIGYLRLLRRRWWIIALAVLITVGAAIGATQLETKRYQTTTRLLVSGASAVGPIDEITQRQLAQSRAVLYSQIASTDPVIAAAEREAESASGRNIAANNPSVSAVATGSDPFLTITVTSNSALSAQALANAFVKVLPSELQRLDQVQSAVTTLLTVVNPAGLPTTPFSPRPERNILIGLVLGLVLGIAAALIRETLDTTIRDSDEVRRITKATVLGVIPREFDDERLPAATRPHSRRSEAYRQVRTNLEFTGDSGPPRSFLVTSAGQSEGKSTTVANLALLISRAGKRVAVVDADLRKPTLAAFFNATSERGLSDVLSGRARLHDVLQPIAGEQISVLASGPTIARPSELLGSPTMENVLHDLSTQFDVVIIDSPPLLAITDALLVGKHTDGVVIVTRVRSTTRSALRRSVEAVENVNARTLGVIVNASVETTDKRYGYARGYLNTEIDAESSVMRPTRDLPTSNAPLMTAHVSRWPIVASDNPPPFAPKDGAADADAISVVSNNGTRSERRTADRRRRRRAG